MYDPNGDCLVLSQIFTEMGFWLDQGTEPHLRLSYVIQAKQESPVLKTTYIDWTKLYLVYYSATFIND